MMKCSKITIFYLLSLLTSMASGQDISVIAEYPGMVRVGEQFSVSWIINTGDGEFSAPSFDGFYKLMGPQTSYSSSTRIVNGRVSRETTYSYVYYLQAVKEGRYVLSPASVTLKNRTYRSDSLRIEVIGGTAVQQGNQAGTAAPGQQNEKVQTAGGDIFLNLSLDRKEVYQGEHIVATVKIFTRVDISGINEIKFPSFEGFIKTDLNTPPLTSLKRENINGVTYGTGVIQQFLLYPQIPGEINIEPVQISVLVQQKTGQSDPFFGDFFSTYTTIPRAVASQPVKIKVNALPGQKPVDFSGIVGKIDLKASLNKDSVNVNDAVNLKIIVSGRGNLKLANIPDLNIPPDIEVYDPKISDNLTNGTNGTTGQKIFEYLLIPRHNGDFKIAPVTLSFFNPASGQYERLTTEELRFHARKTAGESGAITVYGGVSKEDVRYLGKDIRFIKSNPGKLRKADKVLLSKRMFYSSYATAFLIFIAVLFIRREQIKRNSDLTLVRNRKAARIAGKRLKEAAGYLKADAKDKFYEEILKSLWGYLSDKLSIPVSDLTRNNATVSLKEKGINEDTIDNLLRILDSCEFARYAPSSSGAEAVQIFEGASGFIKSVENSIG